MNRAARVLALGLLLVAMVSHVAVADWSIAPKRPDNVPDVPRDVSTGRTTPANLKEKLAMEQVKANPAGKKVPLEISDTKNNLLAKDGWVKKAQNVNGVEVHYVENTKTGQVVDFKFAE